MTVLQLLFPYWSMRRALLFGIASGRGLTPRWWWTTGRVYKELGKIYVLEICGLTERRRETP